MSWIELVAQRRPPAPPQGVTPPENAKDWFRISNSATEDDTAEVLVFDSIGGWFGLYADEFVEQLNEITASNIKLRLNSPGGSVFEGIAIANAIRHHPANVTVYVDSLAASIASVIMLAGDKVVMMPGSQVMVHAASTMCYGNAAEMTETAELLQKQTVNIAMAYQGRAGGTTDEWLTRMDAETWLNAEEAVALGLADEIYTPPKKEEQQADHALAASLTPRTWDLSMYRYAGREKAPAPVAFISGIDLSGDIANAAPAAAPKDIPGATPGTITVDIGQLANGGPTLSFNATTFFEMVRALVREEIADAAPPFLPKKGEDDPEEDDGEEEDEESQPDDSLAAAPHPDEEPPVVAEAPPQETPPDPADHTTETTDKADEFSFVGLLHSLTSPSADDVFSQLKEGW